MRHAKIVCTALCLLLAAQVPALAGTVRVMISGGFSAAYNNLVAAYQKKSGNTVVTVRGPSMGADSTAIPARLARGEAADVVIMVRSALDKLRAGGQVVPASAIDLAFGRVGMAVKAGAPKPDIHTVEAFKQTLLNAKSVAYSDSASGVYLQTVLFKKLGIAKQMAPKSKMIQATPVGLNIARGEYELGFQQLSELKPIPGIDIVGLIPEAVQQITPFAAGLVAKAPNPAGGRGLIRFLTSTAADDAIRASGMQPARKAN
jgi:molybdate transport system substrate-binding protein